jgi:hypothetical protein
MSHPELIVAIALIQHREALDRADHRRRNGAASRVGRAAPPGRPPAAARAVAAARRLGRRSGAGLREPAHVVGERP